ncbi:Ig-like domain-containing protein [Archangium sp.]|uniref:Ig-like domain-containing protein n=1 Tax=Archangium sp. TaxID=1872627 RepID=UPI00389A3BE4
MHLRNKYLYPLLLLCSFGCIDIPEVEGPSDSSGFSLALPDSAQASVVQGDSHTFQVSLARTDGFNDSVTISLVNPPAGVSAQPVSIPSGSTSTSFTVSVGASAEPGIKTLTVRATAGSQVQETTVELRVVRPGDLLVRWMSPSQGRAYVKDSVQLQVSVEGGADFVELLKGTIVLARLSGPSYQYTWDTTQVPEGDYPLTARAKLGSATFTSPVTTITVDRTAPTVQTRTPELGAANVPARQTLQVSFSEALKTSSVTDASVVVSAGGLSIAKALSLSTDGKTLTLVPTAALPVSSAVTISLGMPTAPLMDLAGNMLASSTAWSFSVPTWLPLGGALSAIPGNTPAENVTMKVGVDGNPVVAWAEPDSGGVKNIYARRWNGASWESLGGALSGVDGSTSADMPAMAITPDNQLYLVWQEFNGTNINLHGKKWSGTWEALPAFDSLSGSAQRIRPAITLAISNTPVVATTYYGDAGSSLEPLFWLNPTYNVWSSQSGIEQPSGSIHDTADVQIAIVAAKNAYVVAYDAYSDAQTIRGIAVQKGPSSSSLLGGGVVTSPAKRTATQPSLALDGSDNPYIAWQECPDGSSQSGCGIYAAFWNGSWQMLGTLVSSSTDSTAPSLIMGNDGRPIVAWSGFFSAERSISVSRWTGTAWQAMGEPLSAASGVSTAAFKPALALDKNGRPLVAWQESDGSVSNIYVYRYND